MKPKEKTIDTYIAGFPPYTQVKLGKLRETIRRAAPDATETISYQIPTFLLEGNLVHFAAYQNHIGLYPAPSGTEKFKKELAGYTAGKGSVRFPIDKPLPLALIKEIVKFRVKENLEKAAKKNSRTCRKGHTYTKSSDCPTCPICEAAKRPTEGFLSTISAPARRALEHNGIKTLKHLAKYSEKDVLKFHGMGPGSIPKLKSALKEAGLSFSK